MIFADLDLARRLEGIETWVSAEYGRARLALWPDRDTAVVEVAGGVACYLGEGSPLNEARGMGMAGPVSADDLDVMERAFPGCPVKVNVCPMADPSLLEGLVARGYRAVGFEDFLYRELDGSETFPGPLGEILVGLADSTEDRETCGAVLARGFAAPDEPSAEMSEIFAMSRRVEGLVGLLARVGEQPAGGASLMIRDGLAMLCGAATLPEYRNRGVQAALSNARLAMASSRGCGVVVVGALPGSSSHRNAQRLGFRVAYTKLMVLRDPSGSSTAKGARSVPATLPANSP
jgi:GNAT superfamily N-acetyltransferase